MSVSDMSSDEIAREMGGKIVPSSTSSLVTAREGFDDSAAEAGDLAIPRIKLIQSLSPEVTDGILEVKPGDLLETTSQKRVGNATTPLKVVPIMTWKLWQRWEGTGANAKLVWQSRNPRDPRVLEEAKWGENGEKPLAQESRNFMVLIHGLALPAIVSFAKTSFQAGRQFYTAAFAQGGNLYDFAYAIGSKKVDGEKGVYHIFTWRHAGPSNEEERVVCAEWLKQFGSIKDMIVEMQQEE